MPLLAAPGGSISNLPVLSWPPQKKAEAAHRILEGLGPQVELVSRAWGVGGKRAWEGKKWCLVWGCPGSLVSEAGSAAS